MREGPGSLGLHIYPHTWLSTCYSYIYQPPLFIKYCGKKKKKKLFFGGEDSIQMWIWIFSFQPSWVQTTVSVDLARCKQKRKWFHFFTCFPDSEYIFCLALKQNTICLISLFPIFPPYWNCLIHQVETAAFCIVCCHAEKFNMEHDSLLVINIIISSSILLVAYKYIFVTT